MLLFYQHVSLTHPKGAIESETPSRDEMSVTLIRYTLRKERSEQQKSGPTSIKPRPLSCQISSGPLLAARHERVSGIWIV